jgi:hypothetical protein
LNPSDALTQAEINEFVERLRSSSAKHATTLHAIEARLGLEPGFVHELLDEQDDWAFIIKTAVVVEAALGHVIGGSLVDGKLDRHIRALSMDGRAGKIQLAQDLDIIGP